MKNDTKLSILHLTTHLDIGGITRYIGVVAGEMAKRGHRMTVVSSGGALSGSLKRKGIACHAFPIRVKSELHPKLFLALPRIEALMRTEPFDVIHAHTRVTQVVAFLVAGRLKLPVVTTAHGFFKTNLGRRFFPCWGNKVIAISPLVGEELQKTHGINKDRIRVVDNAIDVEDFERHLSEKDARDARREWGIAPGALVLGCVARLVRDKGQAYLLEAAKLLLTDYPALEVLLVGDGREKEELKRLSERLGLAGRVHFVAGVPDITLALSAMDISIHPATYREGFGLSIAEAMLAGKPVIATDIPAVSHILKNGVNGLLIPPKNAEAIAEAVRTLKNNPAQAQAFAEKGRSMIREICSPRRMADQVEAVYREAIGEKRG